jgi:hypothetical protein
VARHDALAVATGIDLADFTGPSLSNDEQRDLLTAGPLYLAAQLDSAGLSEVTDTMSGLYVTGALPLPRGAVSNRLTELWERRHTRFTAAERTSLFARLFGDPASTPLAGSAPVNAGFRGAMIDLVHAVATTAQDPGYGAALLGDAAEAVARNLAPRLDSVPERAAHDLLDALEVALALFREPDLLRALGAPDPRLAVTLAVQRYLGPRPSLDIALARGSAGQVLLGWVATVEASSARGTLVPPAPVVTAAITWARATIQTTPVRSSA